MMRKLFGGLTILGCGALAVAFATGAFSVGCGSSTTGGTTSGGGTSSGGGTGGTSGGSTGKDAGLNTYCDGFGISDPTSTNQFLIETYSFSGALKAGGCYVTLGGYIKGYDGGPTYVDGYSAPSAGGILDVDQEFYGVDEATGSVASGVAPAALFVGGCDDMGLTDATGTAPDGDGGMNFTMPNPGQTVASVVSAATVGNGPIVGVVTAIYPWTPAAGASAAKSGSFYIQDPVAGAGPAPMGSGTLAYVNKSEASTTLTVPNRGDVVALTGFTWSPYNGKDSSATPPLAGYTNMQDQIASNPGITITVIGNAPLPPPVSLTPADLDPMLDPTATKNKQYYGMRVNVPGPLKVTGDGTGYPPTWTCPQQLQTH